MLPFYCLTTTNAFLNLIVGIWKKLNILLKAPTSDSILGLESATPRNNHVSP